MRSPDRDQWQRANWHEAKRLAKHHHPRTRACGIRRMVRLLIEWSHDHG